MNEPNITKIQNGKVEKLHYESKSWKSNLHFIQDEIIFINRLLNSYAFEPNTPNLFERIQNFKQRLKKVTDKESILRKSITQHENDLGGMLECTDETCDLTYYRKHDVIKAEITDCLEEFRELKTEIFNYAGAILKKKKPTA